jgi:hypothetical protein
MSPPVAMELDAASARFAPLEVREAQRRPLGVMVALTNPAWLAVGHAAGRR